MKYFIVNTKEEKESNVKNQICSLFNNKIFVKIPFKKTKKIVDKKVYIIFEKVLPEYIIIGCDGLTNEIIRKLRNLKDIVKVMKENIHRDEIDRFLRAPDMDAIKVIIGNDPVILFGEHCGSKCTILSYNNNDDTINVLLSTSKQKIDIPVWYIGKEVGG